MSWKSSRAIVLTVAEVNEVLDSLEAAKTLRDLSGNQRQQLQKAMTDLRFCLNSVKAGKVLVRVETLVALLKCISVTQIWLGQMLNDSIVDRNGE